MSFSASHPDFPSRRIAAFEDGVTRAVCGGALEDDDGNDTGMTCDTVVTAVHGSAATEYRSATRDHWRHSRRRDGSNCTTAAMTPWHIGWQEEVPPNERVERTEGRVRVGATTCRPDIVTKYGWVVELQHSALKRGTITTRERVYSGNVLWVIDATTGRTEGISVERFRGVDGLWWRWVQPLWWATEMLGRVAVDTGYVVWLLPAEHSARRWRGGDLLFPLADVEPFQREDFVSRFINSDADPFQGGSTEWHLRMAGGAAKPRRNVERPVLQDSGVCLYEGDRDLLIHEVVEPYVAPAEAAPSGEEPAASVRPIVGLADGPCAKCGRIITRYGPLGHPLCNGCHADMLAATGRGARGVLIGETA